MNEVQALSSIEIAAVSGGESLPPIQPVKLKTVRAQDMYGDTMSHEDWMNWTGKDHFSTGSIFDFPGGKGN